MSRQEASAQLRLLQQSLYDRAYEEARSLVLGSSKQILTYSERFEASLPETFQQIDQRRLYSAVKHADIVLYGDFHTLRQSQRGFLRLVRNIFSETPQNPPVIALELIKAVQQPLLDGYINGEIDEASFLEAIDYEKEWGFPWPNFRMILEFARENSLPVYGINTDNGGRDPLAKRDDFAAAQLLKMREEHPESQVFCMIGEYHLADQHLPRALKRRAGRAGTKDIVTRVLNNVDRYYFDMNRSKDLPSTEYLELRDDLYCIMNTPPWMKWHSFAIWEEMRHASLMAAEASAGLASDTYDSDDLWIEEGFDLDHQFFSFVRSIADFLGLKASDGDLQNFHVYYNQDCDFSSYFGVHSRLTEERRDIAAERAAIDGTYYLPEVNSVLITKVSVNSLAEAAGQYLFCMGSGLSEVGLDSGDRFYRSVIKYAVGMLSSRILNPRRQCPDLQYWESFLERHKGRRLIGDARNRRQIASGVVKHHAWLAQRLVGEHPSYRYPQKSLYRLDETTWHGLSREIGIMLGHRLYHMLITNRVPTAFLRRFYTRPLSSWDDVWSAITQLYRNMI